MANKLWYTDGQKAITTTDIDTFFDYLVEQGEGEDGEISVRVARSKVAFVYRCVGLIADAIHAAPFRITHLGDDDPWDESSDYQNKLGFLPSPQRISEIVARSLLGQGEAYLFKTMQGTALRDLRYMVPSTIEPVIDGAEGLTGFERTIEGKQTRYDVDRFLYFWPADPAVEIGPPKSSPVKAALSAAGADYYTSKFISDFFARGAIKGTLLAVKGNPVESERNRLKKWWDRHFGRGAKTSFSTEIINADSVEPVKIGEGLESLNNNELTKQMREDIAVAMGVPISKLVSSTVSGLGGGSVVESDDIKFYKDTVEPLGEFIAETLNEQLLHDLGFHWSWLWDTLDIYQQEEKERSVAFKTYVDAGMRPEVAAYMLGIEVPAPHDIPEHYEDSFEDKPGPSAFGLPSRGGDDDEPETSNEQAAEVARERAQTIGGRSVDLDKWERMAAKRFEEGSPEKALGFESDVIEPHLATDIKAALTDCETADDVRDLFANVKKKQHWMYIKPAGKFIRETRQGLRDPAAQEKDRREREMERAILEYWRRLLADIREAIEPNVPEERKGIRDLLRGLGADFWREQRDRLRGVLLPFIRGAANEAIDIEADRLEEDYGVSFDWSQSHTEASRWAREHAAELIKDIDTTTRGRVREAVASWLESPDERVGDLFQTLQDDFGFSESRARMIAVTETTAAHEKGHEEAYAQAGMPSVAYGPAAHPRCRCWTSGVLLDNLDWVVVWRTNRDELVCTQPLDVPWGGGTVAGCQGLEDMVVSDGDYLGMTLSEAQAAAQ